MNLFPTSNYYRPGEEEDLFALKDRRHGLEARVTSSGSIRLALLWFMGAALVCGCASSQEQHVIKDIPPPRLLAVPPAKATPPDPELASQARQELDAAMHGNDEVIRAHVLEVWRNLGQDSTRRDEAAAAIVPALSDPSPLVRKAAALASGELQLSQALPRLRQMIGDPDRQERIAVIFALHRLGERSYSHELETTAADLNPRLRADTAVVLGLLGEKSALPILAHMRFDEESGVRLQAAEAMFQLGDERGIDDLVAGTISIYDDERMMSLLALASTHDQRFEGHLVGGLVAEHLEVSLVAARALGMVGSDRGYPYALKGAQSVDPRQRVLAGLALAAIGRGDAQPVLAKLLKDTDPDVRVGAAWAELAIR